MRASSMSGRLWKDMYSLSSGLRTTAGGDGDDDGDDVCWCFGAPSWRPTMVVIEGGDSDEGVEPVVIGVSCGGGALKAGSPWGLP